MIWKDVVGYEGIYEVSNNGLVRTHKEKVTHSSLHGVRRWQQRVLKEKTSKDNTCRVELYKDKSSKTWLVHRIVALAFLEKVEGKNYINHIDGSRLNNHVDNLEWCDHEENNNHAFDNGLINISDKIILMHKDTNETAYFRSKAKASLHLGRSHGYLSSQIKKGKYEIDDYWIFVSPGESERWKAN